MEGTICPKCDAIFDWAGLPIMNEMRMCTVKDLEEELRNFRQLDTDQAAGAEAAAESLSKRLDELNREMLEQAKTAGQVLHDCPDIGAGRRPTWGRRRENQYGVSFGIWGGRYIYDSSESCLLCRLM
jgi:hypothetical protein